MLYMHLVSIRDGTFGIAECKASSAAMEEEGVIRLSPSVRGRVEALACFLLSTMTEMVALFLIC